MRGLLVLSTSVLLATSALAQEQDDGFVADNEVQAQEPAPEPAADDNGGGWDYDWSGNYYGVNLGYSLGHQQANDIASIVSGDRMVTGAVYGGYMGHNFHVSQLVLGTETEFSLANINGPLTIPGSAWACGSKALGCETNVKWFGSWRARAGVSVNSLLPYVTAGVALGGVDTEFNGALINERVTGFGYGYVLGGGVEYALMKNLTLRAEALHYSLSDVKEAIGASDIAVKTNFSVVRVGAAVKF